MKFDRPKHPLTGCEDLTLSILTVYFKSFAASNNLEALAYDNIRQLADPWLFQKLLQGQTFYRAQVANREVGVVESVVGKRFLGDV